MKSKNNLVWTTQEVEKYTQKLLTKSELTISEQREKINLLKVKNAKLTRDLHDLKAREKRVSKALTETSEKVKDTTKVNNMKSSIDIAKVKGFTQKWKNYFDNLASFMTSSELAIIKNEFENDAQVLIDEMVESSNLVDSGDAISFNKKKLIDLSNSDVIISGEGYESGISREDEKRFNDILKEVKSQMIHTEKLEEESESGFSIEEALNPTDSLSDIVNDILK